MQTFACNFQLINTLNELMTFLFEKLKKNYTKKLMTLAVMTVHHQSTVVIIVHHQSKNKFYVKNSFDFAFQLLYFYQMSLN